MTRTLLRDLVCREREEAGEHGIVAHEVHGWGRPLALRCRAGQLACVPVAASMRAKEPVAGVVAGRQVHATECDPRPSVGGDVDGDAQCCVAISLSPTLSTSLLCTDAGILTSILRVLCICLVVREDTTIKHLPLFTPALPSHADSPAEAACRWLNRCTLVTGRVPSLRSARVWVGPRWCRRTGAHCAGH